MSGIMEIKVFGTSVVYLIPIFIIVGTVFVTLFYQLVLRDLVNPSAELKERRRVYKLRMAEERSKEAEKPTKKLDKDDKMTPVRFVLQTVTYSLFAFAIGYFSSHPRYILASPNTTLIKLSLSHPGKRKVPCRRRTRAELAKLAPNMRTPLSCSRERWPVSVKLMIDGKVAYQKKVPPSGIWHDSKSFFYKSFFIPSGKHRLRVVMNDGGDDTANDYVFEKDVSLMPLSVFVVGFSDDTGKLFAK